MRKYGKPGHCLISNTGGLNCEEIAALSDEQLAEYLKRHKQKYRINPDYVLRQIGGEYAIVPVGNACRIQNAVMTPNETAVFLWQTFIEPNTENNAVQMALAEFEAPEGEIRSGVARFVQETLHYKILLEVD